MSLNIVGVVGAGTMGPGLAQSLAMSGHRVILVDVNPSALERAMRNIERNLRLFGLVDRSAESSDPGKVLDRIECSAELDKLAPSDFVIENVSEKPDVKRSVYAELDALCDEEACFGVNTSAMPITRIGSLTGRASRVVGMHFMNPVPLMPMVEVIRGVHTSAETIAKAKELLAQMGKECIVVNDSPGFVTNRVMMLSVNEAIFLLHEGVASVEEIDRLFKNCFGHKMGPLETADLIGLDTILYSIDVLYEEFGDDKYRPCTLLKQMVDAGRLGKKSGRGFYHY